MALDVHEYKDGRMGQLLFQIDDKAYGALQPAFDRFRQRTGGFVDPYGDLIVDSQLSVLISKIAELKVKTDLLAVLEACRDEGSAIIFVGD
ncbi:hypothetical protein HAD_13409 [Hyphomonas adhaerens MHS-3]|uniref:Uncharacterized protein n=1 Tax=Hyphomonas adhaerens MHS-3 TaxID=1280949 RepID=A0A069E7I4_9PROT|nr:hypothetical protein [Hyphomonas adhaerens]KCZ83602.1 hypothetical protein HAD_13409 [Hyphomonas adhaerens MHS-3]